MRNVHFEMCTIHLNTSRFLSIDANNSLGRHKLLLNYVVPHPLPLKIYRISSFLVYFSTPRDLFTVWLSSVGYNIRHPRSMVGKAENGKRTRPRASNNPHPLGVTAPQQPISCQIELFTALKETAETMPLISRWLAGESQLNSSALSKVGDKRIHRKPNLWKGGFQKINISSIVDSISSHTFTKFTVFTSRKRGLLLKYFNWK